MLQYRAPMGICSLMSVLYCIFFSKTDTYEVEIEIDDNEKSFNGSSLWNNERFRFKIKIYNPVPSNHQGLIIQKSYFNDIYSNMNMRFEN